MPQQIDFECLPGITLDAIYTHVRSFDSTKFPQQNGPQKTISGFGLLNHTDQDNTGGRFGWVALGIKIGAYAFYEKPHPINYINQVFRPVEIVPNCLRIFLAPGVNADFSCSTIFTILQDVKKLEDVVLPMIAAKSPVLIGQRLPKLIP